jgi:MerR family transcriptional regulator, heat shock protein HspR
VHRDHHHRNNCHDDGPGYIGWALYFVGGATRQVTGGVSRLDDEDYPAVTMGQAAELLEVQPAFLRSLDAAGVLTPYRSGGGHRRYSRRQLATAARMRALFDEGLNLDAAVRIVTLQDELKTARARIAELERGLARTDPDAADTG